MVLFLIVVLLLAWMASYSTSFVTMDEVEHSFFLADNPLLNVVAVAAGLVLVRLIDRSFGKALRRTLEDDRQFERLRLALLGIVLVAACVWVISCSVVPAADQIGVFSTAAASLDGDWSSFASGGYMEKYPNQIGLFWAFRLFALLFGKTNYMSFQLFNVVGFVLGVLMLSQLTGLMGGSRMCELMTIITCALFFPLLQYCTFVYGNVWGFALAVSAMRFEILYLRQGKMADLLWAGLLVTLAAVVKGNFLVFLIAMFGHAVLSLLHVSSRRVATTCCVLLVAYVVQGTLPLWAARAASGEPLDQGCSSWGWIAMGAQEGPLAPGWWNHYNEDAYAEVGYDKEAHSQVARDRLAQSMEYFGQHKREFLRFLSRKTASQWNNPTFQGLWIEQRASTSGERGIIAAKALGTRGTLFVSDYLNMLQFAMLVGVIAWAVLCQWQGDVFGHSCLLALAFLGGFVCHLLWEAKCQYTLPYFQLLIPFAVLGYSRLLGVLGNGVLSMRVDLLAYARANVVKVVSVMLFVLCVAVLCCSGVPAALTGDEAEFSAYISGLQVSP
jgi:hypothetical protein